MKKILYAYLCFFSLSVLSSQNGNVMESVLKEQGKNLLSTILIEKNNNNKNVTKWIKTLDKELKEVPALKEEFDNLIDLVNVSEHFQIPLKDLLTDIAIYNAMGLKYAPAYTTQALVILNANKEKINAGLQDNMHQHISTRANMRGQVSESLTLLDVHLLTLLDLHKIDKNERDSYVSIVYGAELAKKLTPVVHNMNNYLKYKKKISAVTITNQVIASKQSQFSNREVFLQILRSAFDNMNYLDTLEEDSSLGIASLLLALNILSPNNQDFMRSKLQQVYAHPQQVNVLLDKKDKILSSIQKFHTSLLA